MKLQGIEQLWYLQTGSTKMNVYVLEKNSMFPQLYCFQIILTDEQQALTCS